MTTKEYQDDLRKQRRSVFDAVVGSIKSLKGGNILIEVENRPTIDVRASTSNEINKIDIDILDPEIFGMFRNLEVEKDNRTPDFEQKKQPGESKDQSVEKIKDKLEMAKEFFHLLTDDEASIFDQLKIVKDLAVKLSENNITIVLLRKGKEAIIMGKDASPSLSKIISGSDDLQIKSITESSKLISEIGTTLSSDDEESENKKDMGK
ncbi:MAG: hypothetical protein DA329_04420 [Candidatus Nitrosocosmicus sp.]|jgi:hypothetical protein|nr:hypothetical protein [Nitrosomonas nitrosa]NOJ31370.1 hypothetical protein [Candidatus Nitrosocosmicus sp.]